MGTEDVVARIRELDASTAAAIEATWTAHHHEKLGLLAELVAECGSVTGACRVLGITRARWYQITRGEVPSPWEPPRN